MRLAKNSLWLLLARIGTQGMAALFTIILARRLGSAGFGEYAVIAAIIFVGNMFTTFGTDMSLIREIAARDNLSFLPAALFAQLILSLLLILFLWVGAPLLPNQSTDGILALRIYSFALIPLAFFTVFTSALRGKQLMDAYTLLNLAGSFIQLALIWFFANANVVRLAILLLVSQVVISLVGVMICHVRIPGFWSEWRFNSKDISDLLKMSSPFALLTVLAMLYQRLSILMISGISGPTMTGLFSVAQRIVEAAKTGHVAVFTALYPAMAERKTESFRSSWILLLLGAGLGAVTLSALARPLTLILFGVGYEASVSALQILVWMLIPYSVSTFLTLKFVASNREGPVLRASLVSLAVLASLSLWWIPRTGLSGASGAVLAAESAQAALLFLQSRQYEFSKLSREAHI
ncbi:MAG: flippase [Chloroflexi bacterium]|nr:flippase [Chloroflexota bacterium]